MKTEHKNKILVDDYRDFVALRRERLINFLIDFFIIKIISLVLALRFDYDNYFVDGILSKNLSSFYPTAMLLYYVPFEFLFGKTLGKMVTKTKVVDLYGNKPTFKQIIIRYLVRLVPFEGLSFLGGSRNLASDDKYRPVGWHDRLSSTYVIDEMSKKF